MCKFTRKKDIYLHLLEIIMILLKDKLYKDFSVLANYNTIISIQ